MDEQEEQAELPAQTHMGRDYCQLFINKRGGFLLSTTLNKEKGLYRTKTSNSCRK